MRKLIRNLLNKVGYDIVKVNVHSDSKAKQVKKVAVGKFILDMPGNNPHISNYKYEPQVNSQLGRLALAIAKKYPGLTAIDIGANVGDTIAVIKTVIDIPVIGIEGDPISYSFMERNTRQFAGISLIKEFLGEKKETVQVAMEKGGWNTTLVPSKDSGHMLTLQTLDEVLANNGLMERELKLLKIDTEGFDTIILRGATGLMQQHKPVLYFEFNRSNMDAISEDGLATLLSLENFGYHTLTFFDNKGRYFLSTRLDQRELINQLHYYANESNSEIAYYDVCLFHDDDLAIAKDFIDGEMGLSRH
ncbi:MAG: methyltransferase, FkbM family [Sediminibacterium sp.]|nr:methyltransferase, FkbM family [Sediminibacterium sp.]